MARPEKRRYRKVLCRLHSDAKFMALSRPQPNGQSLWIYLITGPHTTSVPGLFMAGESQLAEALHWPLSGLRRAWDEIERQQMVRADWKARVVWLPNAIRHNPPENPNVVRGWWASLDEIPECALKSEALASLGRFLNELGPAFRKGLPNPLSNPSGNGSGNGLANQEQEQEQEQENNPPTPHADARGAVRLTRDVRNRAKEILRIRFGRCHHEPACENHEACLQAVVSELAVSA